MKPKHRRLAWALAGLACLGVGATVALGAFRDNLVFFRSPSDLVRLRPSNDEKIRLGGMVAKGSVKRDAHGLLHFDVTDFEHTVPVVHRGEVPALFREGQGVVAEGTLGAGGRFRASQLLAKHDENYMPPEVARSLKKRPPT